MKKWMTLFKNLMSKILAEMKVWRRSVWRFDVKDPCWNEDMKESVWKNDVKVSKILAEMKIWRKCLARACLPDLRWEILSQLVAQTPNTDSPRSASSHYLCHHCHHLSLLKLSVSSLSCYQQTHTITIVIIWVSLVAQLEYHLYFKIQGTDKYSKVKSYLGPGHLCHLLLLLKVEKSKEVGDPRVGRDVRLPPEVSISKWWLQSFSFNLAFSQHRCKIESLCFVFTFYYWTPIPWWRWLPVHSCTWTGPQGRAPQSPAMISMTFFLPQLPAANCF